MTSNELKHKAKLQEWALTVMTLIIYKCITQDQAADIIQRVFCDLVKVHGIENVLILSPNRKKGSAVEYVPNALPA